ncbi:MAG TPA: 4'-phosphopantetheinyl transferase superfamily protein [Solirubrobacterales bacterium]|nr:4'-phosphopantetheinyl transferase superfamily protein [Solirubrobacterales bacterium]
MAVLDSAERDSANGKRTERARRAYAIAHAGLRTVLATALGIDPEEVAFAERQGPAEKPALANNTHGLTFNLSHTQDLVVFALARGREVGIDVEWLGRRVNSTALANRYFVDAELAELARAPRDGRKRAFLQLWTRREAHAKMTGEGLRRARASGTGADGPFAGVPSDLLDLDLAPDHVGALAVQSHSS